MSKQYTRNEVATATGKDKTLIILHDNVYDVTSFLNEHPGGEEILLDHGGKDGSDDFDDVGHSQDAFELMKKFAVGELIDAEKSHRKPKAAWTSDYAKSQGTKKEEGMNPMLLIAVVVVFIAILYFVYL